MSINYKKSSSTGEVASISLMRGIASVMVCYFHLSNGNSRLLPDSSIVKMTGEWGWTGVEIFFIISGFVIPYSMFIKKYTIKNVGVFLKKRIIRIEPPYLISILLVLVLTYVSTLMPTYRGAPLNIGWLNVAGHLAYINIFTGAKWLQDIYWTLAVEFQYYLLISIAFSLVASKNIYYRVLFFLILGGLYWLKFLGSQFIFAYIPYFMMGILLFQLYCKISVIGEFWLFLFITTVVLYYFYGPVLTSLSLITLLMMNFVKKIHPFFSFLGTISYSLYLIHIPIGGRIINFSEMFIKNIHVREIMVLVSFLCCILAAYFYYTLIEEKFKAMSSKIEYKGDTDIAFTKPGISY